jgi:hypothetical protein
VFLELAVLVDFGMGISEGWGGELGVGDDGFVRWDCGTWVINC